jgi:hypothetical protein
LDTIQGNRPWCFLPKNFQFLNTDYPAITEFDENYVFSNIQDSVKNADFIAIKLGDVNLSAKGPRSFLPENMERTQPFIFKTKDIFLNKNEKTTLELTPSVELLENGLSAFQLTFNYDKNIDIEAIEAEGFYNFTQANYFIFKNENKIALSWNGKYVENPVLKLKITAKEALQLRGRLSISSDKTVAEAYDEVGTTMPIVLSFDNKKQENNYKLYQNIPNPFSAETTIVCAMPDDCEGQVTIFDVSGKVLKSIKTRFSSGFNQIKIDKNADLTEGVLFYRVETVFGILTQKMVVVR